MFRRVVHYDCSMCHAESYCKTAMRLVCTVAEVGEVTEVGEDAKIDDYQMNERASGRRGVGGSRRENQSSCFCENWSAIL